MAEQNIEINHSSSKPYDLGNLMGDTPYSNFIRSYEDTLPIPDPVEFKIPYAPTMESQIRKLRLSMDVYKELLLNINSVLFWEKQWHPTALIAGCTIAFMLMWLSEPNLLTIISLIGLIITIGDYILPIAVTTVYKPESWNNHKQKLYEEICTNIILYKTKLELLVSSYYRLRMTNPKMYFSVTIFGLSMLTWVGGTVNNFFLTYLLVLSLVLLPGMCHNGFLDKTTEAMSKLFTDLVENAKSKVGTKKIE